MLVVRYQYVPENLEWNFGNLGSIKCPDGQCLDKLESPRGEARKLIVSVGPKRIKAWGHIPIIFVELYKFPPNMDPSTPYLSPKHFKPYKKIQKHVKEMLVLHISKL